VADLLRLVWDRADALEVIYTADDVTRWPPGAIDWLSGLGLLRQAGNAVAVSCDACGGDHVEEVSTLESPPGTGIRAYIPCPEAGRVGVPLERLRRWQIDFARLAGMIAVNLQMAGDVEMIVPSRIWLLGRIALADEAHEVFLARGLCWSDAVEVVGKAARLLQSPRRLILVPGSVPPLEVWQGDAPRVFPLSALLSWNDSRLVADTTLLEACADKRKKPPPSRTVLFPTPARATWEDVRLTVSEHQVRIEVRGTRRTLTFTEAGFEERRRGNVPNRLWRLLRLFGQHGGIIPFDNPATDGKARDNLKQYVTKLGQQLVLLLQIEERPFKGCRRTRRYEARFQITTEEGARFPTPAGVTWDEVSITETASGVIAVSTATFEEFVIPPHSGEKKDSARWEAAERKSVLTREYNLRTLGLADANERPNAAGEALLAVLRGGGKVQRDPRDRAMLEINKRLSDLLQVSGPPFQFSADRKLWSALFEASSAVRDAR
jgi:hypothetical protein